MSACMTLGQAAQWLGQSLSDTKQAATVLERVHTDTRSLQPGDLFVALKGERFDANTMLAQAQVAGAAAAVVQGASAAADLQSLGFAGIEVSDTRAALGRLASSFRAQFALPVIAVTGSNGKTTVTQMVASILRAHVGPAALATEGNFNNDIGVPLTLLRLRPEHRLAVLEMGMNHPGEIAVLAAMVKPTVALVNNAQREHLEFMGSVKAVALENGAVISALAQNGVAVFPADDEFAPVWRDLAANRARLEFAASAHAQAQVYPLEACWQVDAWQLSVQTPEGVLAVRLNQAGAHNVKNAMAAIACALAAGVPTPAIAQGLSAFEPVKGRSRTLALYHQDRAVTLVDDSYNANPDSVRAAIDVLTSLPGPHLLVLGDMGEVGEQGLALHAEVGAYAKARGVDWVMCLGALSASTAQAFGAGQHFDDVQNLSTAAIECLDQAGSVLVKGSRFMKMERVVQALVAASAPVADKARSLTC